MPQEERALLCGRLGNQLLWAVAPLPSAYLLGEGDITACVQIGGVMGNEKHAANSVGHLDEMWPRKEM